MSASRPTGTPSVVEKTSSRWETELWFRTAARAEVLYSPVRRHEFGRNDGAATPLCPPLARGEADGVARNGGRAAVQVRGSRGFTLIEVLTTLGVIALLVGLLVPGLQRARDQAKGTACRSNLRQLAMANTFYTQDSGGYYAPGAAEFLANLRRWHGLRSSVNEPFEPSRGPLVDYMGQDRAIRACPEFVAEKPGFESGCGGYGYNNAYIGVQTATCCAGKTQITSDRSGARQHQVKRPADTLMFADTAFVDGQLIEYSFSEPRFHPALSSRADPSVHFRHLDSANAAWCDGHVTSERQSFTWSSGLYEGSPDRHGIGWFGSADDNSLFDLQ